MGRRGPRPQPTALKMLRGNPGRRPLNDREPQHAALMSLDAPENLTGDARVEWDRVVEALTSAGQVTEVDRGTLIAYCLKFGQWQELEAEAKKHPFIVRAPSGYPIPNPAIGMANRCFALMLKAAAELGITPSSRSRVIATSGKGAPAAAGRSKLAKFLRRVK
jgi:P27 family predicted phage terminase small subunit